MKPYKPGQVAKFHTPLPEDNPDQLYVVLEVIDDVEIPRIRIKALNTGLAFPPVNTVLSDDLEVVEAGTADLLGYRVTISKPDRSQATGLVVKAEAQKKNPELTKVVNGVETNIWLTIQDESGKEHTGTLFVN